MAEEQSLGGIAQQLELGQIKIAPEVVSIVAGIAATEVEGVHDMAGGFAQEVSERLGMKSLSKGVRVRLEENKVSVDLYLVVEYGSVIKSVALEVQRHVRETIETMTHLKVEETNVFVQEVFFPAVERPGEVR